MQTLKDLTEIVGEDAEVLCVLVDKDIDHALQELRNRGFQEVGVSGEERRELILRVSSKALVYLDTLEEIVLSELKGIREEAMEELRKIPL